MNGFKLANCPDQIKLKSTLKVIPLNNQGLLNDVTEWDLFKERLIDEIGSILVYGRDINQDFALHPRFESECAEILTPKIKNLQSNLKIMLQFFDFEDLHSVTLTLPLVQNIMRSLPLEVKSSFNQEYADFSDLCPANVRPPIKFTFLAQLVCKIEKNYLANPSLYDLDSVPSSIGVKLTIHEPPNSKSKPQHSASTPSATPRHPCFLCTVKGFQADHFALSKLCGVGKLSAPDILKLITDNHLCPSCTLNHDANYKCRTTYPDGRFKVCTKGCLPVHFRACMHSNQAPYVTVSKVSMNKSVPLVEDILVDKITMGIQYDT